MGSNVNPTWRELRNFLNSLSDDDPRLDQLVEVMPYAYHQPEPVHLTPVVAWGTVEEMLHVDGKASRETRSAANFKHEPGLLILICDSSPYDDEGNSVWEMLPDGKLKGNKTGKIIESPFGDDK